MSVAPPHGAFMPDERTDFKKPEVEVFDAAATRGQLKYVYERGLLQGDPYWNFGWPMLNDAVPELTAGTVFIIAPENVGKSMFMLNLGYGTLLADPNVFWLDFSLDDSVENRYGYLMARAGQMPIALVKRAGEASEEEVALRKQAFGDFNRLYAGRYRCIGVSAQQNDAESVFRYSAEWIGRYITYARKQIGADKKLLVTIDGFHDIDLEERAEDDNSKQAAKSRILKRDAAKANALLVMSAHCRKDSRRRGMTSDILKGDDSALYDAAVICHLYSDVGFNRDGATVFWTDENDVEQRLMPVLELDVLKNKAGGFRGVRFYPFDPRRAFVWEADEGTQSLYRGYIYAK
jgi:replicative DNA helicase